MKEAGALEVPKTAEEAERFVDRAKAHLRSKKKKSLRDVVFVGVADQRAKDMREAEERGEEYVPRSRRGRNSLASRIVQFAKENPEWEKKVPEEEEKEDTSRGGGRAAGDDGDGGDGGDGDDETRPLMHS